MAKSESKKSGSSKKSSKKSDEEQVSKAEEEEQSKIEAPDDGGEAAAPDNDAVDLTRGPMAREIFVAMCNMFDEAGAQMLVYALDNPIDQQAVLAKRQELLQALYKLRYLCDCDSQFSQLDFEGEMRKIRKFRLKMQRLQEKEDVDRDSDESESSDDTEGDDDHLDIMKEARKNMAYAFGTQIDAMTARHTTGTVAGW
jgi:hypothetical protein